MKRSHSLRLLILLAPTALFAQAIEGDDTYNKQADVELLKEANSPAMVAGPSAPLTKGQKKELREFPVQWKQKCEDPCMPVDKPCNLTKVCVLPRTLQETLEVTYMQNADLDAARAGLRAQVETLSQANADWRPSLSVVGTQNNQWHASIGEPPPANAGISRWNEWSSDYTVQAKQNVFKGGATMAQIGVSESDVFAGTYDLVSLEQKTLYDAVHAHTDVIAKQTILDNERQREAFAKTRYEYATARYEVGDGSRGDQAYALAQYEEARAEVANALGNLEAAKAVYMYQTGVPPENLKPATIIKDIPKTCEEAVCVAQKKNPSIVAAQYKVEAAEYNVNLQVAGLLPTVDVQGNFGNDRRGGTTLPAPYDNFRQTNASFQGVVNVPLYAQGIPNSKIRQAYQTLAQAKVQKVGAQRKAVQDTNAAWATYLAAQESLKNFIAQVKALEISVEGAVEEYNVGLKSIVDVFVERDKLTQGQNRLAQAQQRLIESTYGVLQAMGSLTACELKLHVKLYDPKVYYTEYKEAWIQFWEGEDKRYVKEVNPR